MREVGHSQARAGLADIYDDALQHLPTRITRRRADPAVLVSLEDFARLLDRFEFTPEVLLEASAVSIWLPELAIWGRGVTFADARADLRDEIGEGLSRHILRDQLRVTEEQFWGIVRGGETLLEPPHTAAPTVPGWLVERLLFTVGLPESEIRAMTADEAGAAWNAHQARPQEDSSLRPPTPGCAPGSPRTVPRREPRRSASGSEGCS